jgi:hypothetical protein
LEILFLSEWRYPYRQRWFAAGNSSYFESDPDDFFADPPPCAESVVAESVVAESVVTESVVAAAWPVVAAG